MTDDEHRQRLATSPTEVKGVDKERPGPADHGREGGMATREVAPDVADEQGTPEPPD
ncbi:hypothetical protein BH10ACT9_BH10ACT9_07470 [soil metagenome]|jgi:basic amino acid/polyamine antiporter, APA family